MTNREITVFQLNRESGKELDIPFTSEWPDEYIENADAMVAQTADAIRLFYYRQLPLLRQIPYLALEANGRGGWNDELNRAYTSCIMPIHQEGEYRGPFDMFIELRSGALINTTS